LKREAFIKELTDAGCHLKRHGKKHDIYFNPKNGKKAPVPLHTEIKDTLCTLIRKQLAEVIDGWIIIRLKKGLPIPNPHKKEIGVDLLIRILGIVPK